MLHCLDTYLKWTRDPLYLPLGQGGASRGKPLDKGEVKWQANGLPYVCFRGGGLVGVDVADWAQAVSAGEARSVPMGGRTSRVPRRTASK
ncbi:hypothetical protein Pan216_18130 [Planctomycetes bacterium Pan216]|uniref:Uncharacterized protein n=1 Tax=Kolteria novifilia TaxID=2527975 RepID=A0A518B1V2_9BACT|nr:hypothetical protein Pan216_18130 [Planctomycetes bacterium Pan216]